MGIGGLRDACLDRIQYCKLQSGTLLRIEKGSKKEKIEQGGFAKSFLSRDDFCYDGKMNLAIGIDEVGRGPVAGPVAVCAFRGRISDARLKKAGLPLRDSKKLTRREREIWFSHIQAWQKEGRCDFCVTMISARSIDRIGIAKAIRRALERSLYDLEPKNRDLILLDGGLRAPLEFKNQKTIIKGDEKETVIALASIAAKVTRDQHMFRQAKKFPEYGFEAHVGYGTPAHYRAIKRHGLTPLHRKSFLKTIV